MLTGVNQEPLTTSHDDDQEEQHMTIHDDGVTARTARASDPGPFPNRGQNRRRGLRITTAAAVALGLAVGGGAVANASGSSSSTSTSTPGAPSWHGVGGTPPAAFGTVATVGTDTFTLTTHDGTTVRVHVGSTTTYVDGAVASPSLADVTVGARVAVFGTDTANTVTATKVAIGDPGGPGGAGGRDGHGVGGTPPAAFGTVATVGTDTFTLTTHDGTTVTVDVNSSTSYLEFGVTSATIADVKAGTQVAVFGTDTANTVTATKVGIGGPRGAAGGTDGPGHGDGDGPMGGMPPSGTGTASTNSTNFGTGSSTLA